MAGSTDDLPVDGIPLDDIERAKHEYGLDEKQARALSYITRGLPIKGFEAILSGELWLREVLKDLEGNKCPKCKKAYSTARSKALQLMGEYLGMIGNKAKKKSSKKVVFDED